MGYSKSPHALSRVKQHLDQLVNSSSEVIFLTPDPSRLSYHIREGINVAKSLVKREPTEPYLGYARLASKFVIRTEPGKVRASLRDVLPIVTLKQQLSVMSFEDITGTLEIVGAAIKHKAPEMFFPDASENTCDLSQVYAWASKNGYHLIPSDEGITLTRNDPGEIAWKPLSSQR